MWSHNGEDFYTYFNLVNMPVLKSLDDIPEDATFHPSYWKGNLDKHITNEFLSERAKDNLNLNILSGSFDADVIVYSCIGNRALYADSSFFGNVFRVIDPRILSAIQTHSRAYPLSNSWGIHIRGTDRLREHRRVLSVQSIVSHITTLGGLNKTHMVVVSDDKENADLWKRFYPNSYIVSQFNVDARKGIHNLSKEELKRSKDELNVCALIDFFILCKCEKVFSTVKDSRFAQEARRLHSVVDKILS
jgi:hypothetical protein